MEMDDRSKRGVAASWAWRTAFLALLMLGVSGEAGAASGDHKVPDLRGERSAQVHARAALLRIPVTVHLAVDEHDHPATMRRLSAAIARANLALSPFQIELVVRAIEALPGSYGSITRRRDRRRIAHHAPRDGTLHVFMVSNIEIGSARSGDRSVRGLHWRYSGVLRKLREREYVVVSGDAPVTTLAHEVGHFFGLDHSEREENLMCSCRRGPRQIFSARQGSVIRAGARGFLSARR